MSAFLAFLERIHNRRTRRWNTNHRSAAVNDPTKGNTMRQCKGILGRIFGHRFVHCWECMWEPGYCLRCGVKPEVES